MIWYKNNDNDIVISTRIRLARNLDATPFPNALSDTSGISEKIKSAVMESNSTLSREFEFINLDSVSEADKLILEEEHMISPQMVKGEGRSVLINKDKTMSIMLMEEDHIRLQIIESGYKLDEAYKTASRVDDVIEENLTYAFDEDFGYLTACPTNTGTGMRASVMMHLPALTITNSMNKVISSAGNLGIAVRGLYGEGTKAEGNLYQISNQITMGLTEEEILSKLKNIVNQIIEMEKSVRDSLKKNNNIYITDKVSRAYGILKYAKSVSSSEAKTLLSDVMLGQNMDIIPKSNKMTPLECMIKSSPAIIGANLSPEERDVRRAEFIRNNI